MIQFLKGEVLVFILLIPLMCNAQVIDSTTVIRDNGSFSTSKTIMVKNAQNERTPFFKKKLVRTMIVPAILIGWGVSVIHDRGLYSSIRCSTDVAKLGISPGFSS